MELKPHTYALIGFAGGVALSTIVAMLFVRVLVIVVVAAACGGAVYLWSRNRDLSEQLRELRMSEPGEMN